MDIKTKIKILDEEIRAKLLEKEKLQKELAENTRLQYPTVYLLFSRGHFLACYSNQEPIKHLMFTIPGCTIITKDSTDVDDKLLININI
jgi:hypothetical protein